MSQISRINKYEKILDNANKTIKELTLIVEKYAVCQKEIEELDKYYGSDDWYLDVDSYDMKLLPKDIKVGILSEDAIYDLLNDNKQIAIKLLEVATKTLKR